MADVTWPATLPAIELGSRETRQEVRLFTPQDQGPSKVRRQFTTSERQIDATIVCTQAQSETFWTFFDDTSQGGTLSFDYTDPHDAIVRAFFFGRGVPSTVTLKGQTSGAASLVRISFTLRRVPT